MTDYRKRGYPNDLRLAGLNSEVNVYDAKTGEYKRTEPAFTVFKRKRAPVVLPKMVY